MLNEVDRMVMRTLHPSYGVATRSELLQAGLSSSALDRRLRAGALVPVFPGVYRSPLVPEDWSTRLFAAWKWAGDDAMVRARAMARLIGLEGFGKEPLQVYLFNRRSHPEIQAVRGTPHMLSSCRWWCGMRTTSVERMLFDLCSEISPLRAGQAMDQCLIQGYTAITRLRDESLRVNGSRGSKVFRGLLTNRDDQDDRVRSVMEMKMLSLLRKIPARVYADHEVSVGGRRYFLDFAFPNAKVAIECHSRKWHAGAEALKQDSRRHRDLTLAGWTVLYYTWDDIRFRGDELVQEISAFLVPTLPLA